MYVVNSKGSFIVFIAGMFILASILLTLFISPYWIIGTAIIGLNLIISSLTGFSVMEKVLVSAGLTERQVVKK